MFYKQNTKAIPVTPKLYFPDKQAVKENTKRTPKFWTWVYESRDDIILSDTKEFVSYKTGGNMILETYHGKRHLRYENTGRRIVYYRSEFIGTMVIF